MARISTASLNRKKIMWTCAHTGANGDNDSYNFIKYQQVEGMSALTCAINNRSNFKN